ncbi:methyltransferase domain-containing protein [Paenactinomyces guangxiensis]|uniref:Methyltransferase domain-containing protein n=1 Tax=Paenactinomyces guangxiensis TaxID=1490290 RepID=A0A7W1WQ48_9BACL|nr:methyltransferase domain-containing protein [Paenactinomyces guangxiensis]MBA4493841.1 methyltransferase domain-containing protein [Paenactinomyces guangxiensis]MBH8591307.1 methyltransferase domain-containing protein [Paenactinomyces guangxiensis]
MKKIELAKCVIRKHSNIFMCLLCGATMNMNQSYSLICLNRHCFDLSKYGYIHLLPNPVKPAKYDKKLFESRHVICRSGFFAGMTREIAHIVRNEIMNAKPKRIHILDVGCGEGSHLADLAKNLSSAGSEILGVGTDISKDAVRIASREYPGLIWCVSDLARSPFRDRQFDVILSIFSPANYSEFARMLDDEGVLIKVVPGRNYLKELRKIFYGQTGRQTYSNEHVVTHFSKHYNLIYTQQLQYEKRLDLSELNHLIHMTPLSWGKTEETMQKVLQSNISSATIDVIVLVGKKRLH